MICPFQDDPQFEAIQRHCAGPRISLVLENVGYEYDEQDRVISEAPPFACGSEISPDRELPSISVDGYAMATLSITALRRLYDRGLLPEQVTKE
jgi:hypothetical protein